MSDKVKAKSPKVHDEKSLPVDVSNSRALANLLNHKLKIVEDITSRLDLIGKKIRVISQGIDSLAQCPARFNGRYDGESLERFINNVETYKRSRYIRDEQALQDLCHLLEDHAYAWYLKEKDNLKTWSEAMEKLRTEFSNPRSMQELYDEIVAANPDDKIPIEDFVNEKRFLFAQLPLTHMHEARQVSMIYVLLPKDVRDKIHLKENMTYAELMKAIKSLRHSS